MIGSLKKSISTVLSSSNKLYTPTAPWTPDGVPWFLVLPQFVFEESPDNGRVQANLVALVEPQRLATFTSNNEPWTPVKRCQMAVQVSEAV